VSFCFDDFPMSAATRGAAILEEEGCRGTYYLSCGLFGADSPVGRIVSAEHAQHLAASGHEIGCHTYSHLKAEDVNSCHYGADITKNGHELECLLPDQPVRSFAFPYGSITPRTKAAAADHYATCRTTLTRINRGHIDLNQLSAIALYNHHTHLATVDRLLADCANNGGWLIIYTHDVDDNCSQYGCTPSQFRTTVTRAIGLGCAVQVIGDFASSMIKSI
jgi:peptidoglycan/xylan/chitin deacetylase (PgdA/CDA1 family)